tara:strand:+ start:1091 stop:1393 length:303 start_codon:yes stop_codon:yes gene_type:complete
MLSTSSRLKIQDILKRLARGQEVSLSERIYVKKHAERDQSVFSWLKRARRIQQKTLVNDSIDNLMNQLDLGSSEPSSSYNPEQEDLGDWFKGAPSWLGRS